MEDAERSHQLTIAFPSVPWPIVRYRGGFDVSSSPCVAVEQFPAANGPADYASFVHGVFLGIIEAKEVTVNPQNLLAWFPFCRERAWPRRPAQAPRRLLWLTLLAAAILTLAPLRLAAEGRTVVLQDAQANLRELGGLPTEHGPIRTNLIYRSAALWGLSPGDVATLEKLRIRTLVDLRRAAEITPKRADPPAWLQTLRTRILLSLDAKGATTGSQYYKFVLRQHPEEIRSFFGLLAETNNLPLLFHCAHGKDRTGIMTALLLMSLGTPRDVITADYLQSHGTGEVKQAWIEAFYQEVDAAGGIAAFLEHCGVSTEVRRRVRVNLTGPIRPTPRQDRR
jgi:protein-tyrosine phosphatase